jgi:hypothetical protein
MGALPESGRPSPYWWATLCSGSASTAGRPVERREPERLVGSTSWRRESRGRDRTRRGTGEGELWSAASANRSAGGGDGREDMAAARANPRRTPASANRSAGGGDGREDMAAAHANPRRWTGGYGGGPCGRLGGSRGRAAAPMAAESTGRTSRTARGGRRHPRHRPAVPALGFAAGSWMRAAVRPRRVPDFLRRLPLWRVAVAPIDGKGAAWVSVRRDWGSGSRPERRGSGREMWVSGRRGRSRSVLLELFGSVWTGRCARAQNI